MLVTREGNNYQYVLNQNLMSHWVFAIFMSVFGYVWETYFWTETNAVFIPLTVHHYFPSIAFLFAFSGGYNILGNWSYTWNKLGLSVTHYK